jgi:hypothetical protein
VQSKENGLEVNVNKLSTWSCLEIRMHDEVGVERLTVVPLKGWKINILEQSVKITILLRRELRTD